MRALLAACRAIDRNSEPAGQVGAGGVLAACLASAGIALVRQARGAGSDACREIQGSLFAADS